MNKSIEALWFSMTSQSFEYSLPPVVAEFFRGKNILITGSSGFLARQIIQMLRNDAPELGDIIGIDLVSVNTHLASKPTLFYQGACGDQSLLSQIFKENKIDKVIHCAAEKHLPQLQNDPFGALTRNTFQSINFLGFCLRQGVKDIMYVSTDKATEPKSIYGASKRFPELYLAAQSPDFPVTNVSCIRLGNIFGSSGSVIEQWSEQLNKDRVITLRGHDMKRIFVSPSQAALYCLSALELSQSLRHKDAAGLLRFGPSQQISWSIEQLAHNWLKQKGITERQEHINRTPALAGEKHSEIIWSESDTPLVSNFLELSYVVETAHSKIDIVKALSTLEEIYSAAQTHSDLKSDLTPGETQVSALAWIQENVPDFAP